MNCWILCLPRSGSTFLSDVLNKINIFPKYKDTRLNNVTGPIQKDMAFNEWLRIFSDYHDLCKNPPPCCKAIYHQYIEVMGNVPKNKRRRPDVDYIKIDKEKENFVKNKFKLNAIQSLFTSIKFIKLKRDVFSQTVSTYFARKTQKYHLYNQKEAEIYFNKKIIVDYNELINIYNEIKDLQECWDRLTCRNNKCITVYYEELIENSINTLDKILKFLEFNFDKSTLKELIDNLHQSQRTYKMTRPESLKVANKLKYIIKSTPTNSSLNKNIYL